jgi:hypothetical protein
MDKNIILKDFASIYSFHDANINYIEMKEDNILFIVDLLNVKDNNSYTFTLNFYKCNSITINGELPNNWSNISATILEYNILEKYLKLFIELTNYSTKELVYCNIEFNYNEFISSSRSA